MVRKVELPIEAEYNRFIPPVVEETKEKFETTWDDDATEQELIENDDGSVDIMDPEESVAKEGFGDNLAESISNKELSAIAQEYLDLIEKDQDSRKRRDEQYEEGIRRTGLGEDAPGGAQFAGASKVVHPVLAEGCVDFAARAIKELCPPNGPVRTQVLGKTDGVKLKKANRKRDYMNWQLTKQCPEFFTEMEQMLSQLPLGGSQYIKVLPHARQRRPEFEFVPIDKVLVPFSATNFYTSQRVTHVQELTEQTYEKRVGSGYYRDKDILAGSEPEQTKSEVASNKVEGKEASSYNEDGLRTVYEVSCYAEFEFDTRTKGELAPYIVAIDDTEGTVLAIYRNWLEDDDKYMQKLDWLVEFKFIPWRGAQGIGLPHLIGGIAAALTGALRALLDTAHQNNAPTLLKLKGARLSAVSTQVEVTQIQEIEGVPGATDIRQLMMPIPFNPPSQVLFQLLDWLTNAAKGVVATAEEKISDASNQMPVGTALALIEQGSINYAAIHMRLHNSMAKLLEIVCRINYDVLYEEEVIEQFGEEIVYRADFDKTTDILPVSDPNIFSETQRYAQVQAVMQLMQTAPDLYDNYEVHRRALELMKVASVDDILPPKQKPVEMNAIAENITVMLKNPIMVFEQQDHLSHIEAHLRFITDPNFGGSSLAAPIVIPALLEHINDHIAFFYGQTCELLTNQATNGQLPDQIKQMDAVLAAISAQVSAVSAQVFTQLQPMIQQAQETMKQYTPPQPLDPATVQQQIGMAEIERQTSKDQGEMQHKNTVEENSNQEALVKHQATLFKQQSEKEVEVEKLSQQADKLKAEATAILHKAANEQERVALQGQQQEIDYQLRAAELERKEDEFAKKLWVEEQKAICAEPATDPRIDKLLANQKAVLEALKRYPTLQDDSGVLLQAGQDPIEDPRIADIMNTLAALEASHIEATQKQATQQDSSGVLLQTLQELIRAQNAPRMIIKDQQGRPVGVAPVPQ